MRTKIPSEAELSKGDLWVFGYGSLMWRPGFEFLEQVPHIPWDYACRLPQDIDGVAAVVEDARPRMRLPDIAFAQMRVK